MRRRFRSARLAMRTAYTSVFRLDRGEHGLGGPPPSPREALFQHGHRVLEILQGLLEAVPPIHGDSDRDRTAALGDQERVVAETRELVLDAVPESRLWDDASRHARSVRAN